MQKKLSTLGNSVALVIDKPIRRLLGIGRNTVVEVSTDGRRIVIEPISPAELARKAPALGLALDAERVFWALMREYAMTTEQFGRLYHGIPRPFRYVGWLSCGGQHRAEGQELADMHR